AAFLAQPGLSFRVPQLDKQIDLDLDNAPVRDAVRDVLKQASVDADVEVAEDVPSSARVTLKAKGVRVSTALDLIAQAAGAGWSFESKDKKSVLRVGKTVRPNSVSELLRTFTARGAAPWASTRNSLYAPDLKGLTRIYGQQRYTFTCPHCKGQVTGIRQAQAPACPKCGRIFEPDWKFCPVDG